MYITNSTNSTTSSAQSNSMASLQLELWEEENKFHHPDYLMIDQVFKYYHQALKLRPQLIDMLIRRKIDPDYVDRFNLGFSDRTLGGELQSPKCLTGSRNRGHLQRLGLLKPSGHEFFRGSMVCPYFNDDGQIVGAYGRRPKQQRRSPAYHLYWNTQQVSFFNVGSQGLPKSLVLCKSELDALTLLTAGIDNVVATMGVKGFNDIQLTRLLSDSVKNVYIAFDNTPTANHYARLVAQALDTIGITCFRVKLPLGQDVNQFALNHNDVSGAFNCLLKQAALFKQHHGNLVPSVRKHWVMPLVTIEDSISFYLEGQRQSGRSSRTVNSNRIHLERFRDYCSDIGMRELDQLSEDVLTGYECYLKSEKNIFTGETISSVTQGERMSSVINMLSRLHHYGVILDALVPDNCAKVFN